jgi:hypothetical protein
MEKQSGPHLSSPRWEQILGGGGPWGTGGGHPWMRWQESLWGFGSGRPGRRWRVVVLGSAGGRSSREAVDAVALRGGGGGRPGSRREPRPRLRKLRPLLRELAAGWFCSSPGCLRARCPQCLRELAARVSSRVCGERAGGHRPGEEEVIGGRWLCPARARFAG